AFEGTRRREGSEAGFSGLHTTLQVGEASFAPFASSRARAKRGKVFHHAPSWGTISFMFNKITSSGGPQFEPELPADGASPAPDPATVRTPALARDAADLALVPLAVCRDIADAALFGLALARGAAKRA